jgi:hypothetical protein
MCRAPWQAVVVVRHTRDLTLQSQQRWAKMAKLDEHVAQGDATRMIEILQSRNLVHSCMGWLLVLHLSSHTVHTSVGMRLCLGPFGHQQDS